MTFLLERGPNLCTSLFVAKDKYFRASVRFPSARIRQAQFRERKLKEDLERKLKTAQEDAALERSALEELKKGRAMSGGGREGSEVEDG